MALVRFSAEGDDEGNLHAADAQGKADAEVVAVRPFDGQHRVGNEQENAERQDRDTNPAGDFNIFDHIYLLVRLTTHARLPNGLTVTVSPLGERTGKAARDVAAAQWDWFTIAASNKSTGRGEKRLLKEWRGTKPVQGLVRHDVKSRSSTSVISRD